MERETEKLFCWLGVSLIAQKIISKALTDAEISHEELLTLVSNGKKYLTLDDIIITKDSQRSYINRDRLIEHDTCIRANKLLRQNESPSLKLKTQA